MTIAGIPRFKRCRRAVLALAILLSPAAAAARPQNPRPAVEHLFGSREVRNPDISAFTKWTGVIERTARYGVGNAPGFSCRLGASLRCTTVEWREFVASIKGKDRRAQLAAVNNYMNQFPYITDLANWGVPDYWATLGEFLAKSGDCEDYAIAKYYTLKLLGFDASKMRIVVVEDENLHVPHAILAVFMDGKTLILDNQIPEVVRDTSIVNYRPIYSINEQAWWFHQMPANWSPDMAVSRLKTQD